MRKKKRQTETDAIHNLLREIYFAIYFGPEAEADGVGVGGAADDLSARFGFGVSHVPQIDRAGSLNIVQASQYQSAAFSAALADATPPPVDGVAGVDGPAFSDGGLMGVSAAPVGLVATAGAAVAVGLDGVDGVTGAAVGAAGTVTHSRVF